MNLFDKQFVYFIYDKVLKGKQVFVADNIKKLIEIVNSNKKYGDEIMIADEEIFDKYNFVYYDPMYETKRAKMNEE